jgi:acid phosphatase (class A)
MRRIATFALTTAFAVVIAGCAVNAQQPAPQPVPQSAPQAGQSTGFFAIKGYLPRAAIPDSLLLDPAPPAAGSAAEARDIEGAKAAVALRGTPRWTLATHDADIMSPNATATFSCAAGFAIGAQTTPKLDMLMQRVARDLAGATGPTKRKYMRGRPFMANGQPTCTPDMEEILRKDGSYPSGHSSLGYGWGLVLAEAVPDRSAQLVARGRAFGDSRRICNVHWLSDIEEGRIVASAVVARLNAEPEFQADLAAARAEAAVSTGKPLLQDCTAEAALLAL